MGFISRGYDGPTKIKYLFVDGGCLDSILDNYSKKYLDGEIIDIDYRKIFSPYTKVFYYDCIPEQKVDEDEDVYQNRIAPKIERYKKLLEMDKVHAYEGTARFRNKRKGQEQKQVDIMIAVDMLTHSFRRNMHDATLLTGDLDFKPLIDALVQDGMYVTLLYPKGKTNYELVDSADSKIPITITTLKNEWVTENYKQKMIFPSCMHVQSINAERYLQQEVIDEYDYNNCKIKYIFLGHKYAAICIVKHNTNEYIVYTHEELDKLKFYIYEIYRQNVRRDENYFYKVTS